MTTTFPMPVPSHPLLDRLWTDTVADVPYARMFVEAWTEQTGTPFENDHIALRTLAFAGEGSGLSVFVPVFERLGWQVRDAYVFDDVHLRAVYLSQPGLPRVFVSELDPHRLPPDARNVLLRSYDRTPAPATDDVDALAAWFRAPPPPNRHDVDAVHRASQYGAWLLCFGRRVNHFTAAVDDVAFWQRHLAARGVPMKASIEGEPIPAGSAGLRQTATAAAEVDVVFADGSRARRPYAYFEIAERKGGFDGFLATQARQLFDMTRLHADVQVER